jgi:hypothetical protein
LGALAGVQRFCPGRATLQPSEPAKGNGVGILGRLYGLEFRGLPSRFKHDLVGKLVRVAWALL